MFTIDNQFYYKDDELDFIRFTYKGMRTVNIMKSNTVYTVYVIAESNDGIVTTEFWIKRSNYKYMTLGEVFRKELSDKDCIEKIKERLSSWIYDYDHLIMSD